MVVPQIKMARWGHYKKTGLLILALIDSNKCESLDPQKMLAFSFQISDITP